MARPWESFAHLSDDGRALRPMSEQQWRRGLDGKRQQMAAHDAQPQRMRELVGEHNVTKAVAIYREEQFARPRCQHGRLPESCAQCTYAAARGRDGAEVTRKGGTALDRVRRHLDV